MITRFDVAFLLCLYGCMISNSNQTSCNKPCICLCDLTSTRPNTTRSTQNPSTSDCSCPTIEATENSKCPSANPTTKATTTTTQTTTITTTTPQISTTTETITTTSSAYQDPIEQKSGLCSDNQAIGFSLGAVIGAAIGGTIFGSILTAIIIVYFRRRSKNSYISKNDQPLKTVRNAAYTNDIDQVNSMSVPVNSAYTEINDGVRKSAVISPTMRHADSSKNDEVYNHLGESDKEDRSDYYDHAGPAPSLSVMEGGYGVLSIESKGNDNYNTVDRDYSTDCGKSMTKNKQCDNYFLLETKNS